MGCGPRRACERLSPWSGGLRGTLTDAQDPYVLYVRDVVLFRAGAQLDYRLVQKPVTIDVPADQGGAETAHLIYVNVSLRSSSTMDIFPSFLSV